MAHCVRNVSYKSFSQGLFRSTEFFALYMRVLCFVVRGCEDIQ